MKKSLLVVFFLFFILLKISIISQALVPDSDSDGVPNSDDKCPGSLSNVVDQYGCTCYQKTRSDCKSLYTGAACCLPDSNQCTDDCGVDEIGRAVCRYIYKNKCQRPSKSATNCKSEECPNSNNEFCIKIGNKDYQWYSADDIANGNARCAYFNWHKKAVYGKNKCGLSDACCIQEDGNYNWRFNWEIARQDERQKCNIGDLTEGNTCNPEINCQAMTSDGIVLRCAESDAYKGARWQLDNFNNKNSAKSCNELIDTNNDVGGCGISITFASKCSEQTTLYCNQYGKWRYEKPDCETSLTSSLTNLKINQDVEDVKQLTSQLLNLNKVYKTAILTKSATDQQQELDELKNIAKQRKDALLKLIKENPQEFLDNVMPTDEKEKLPAEVQANIESEVTVQAYLEVLHIDDFENKKAEYKFFLNKGNERLEFYPVIEMPSESGTVQVKGYQLEDKIAALVTQDTIKYLEAPPLQDTKGDQKTLVVLINLLDSPPPLFSKEKIKQIVFNGQIQKFYKEASYNQVSFSGDVIGWYTLPRNAIVDGNCKEPIFGGDASYDEIYRLIKKDVDIRSYQRLVLVLNHECIYTSGTVGKIEYLMSDQVQKISVSSIGSELNLIMGDTNGYSFEWSFFDEALVHEMGHNLGLWHANSWECGVGSNLYGYCKHIEYGNRFDIMGYGSNSLHFNAFYKDILKWFDTNSILAIDKSGRYTLNPLELAQGVRAAKIQPPAFKKPIYYLEFRKKAGFDSALNQLYAGQGGIFVNWIRPYYMTYSSGITGFFFINEPVSRLLDINPNGNWDLVTLKKGEETFVDNIHGITIGPVINQDDSSITFDVKINEPVGPNLRIEPNSYYIFMNKGDNIIITRYALIYNDGIGNQIWSLSTDSQWLKVKGLQGETSGVLGPDKFLQLELSANPAGLNADAYIGNIIFNSNVGTFKVPVRVINVDTKCLNQLGNCGLYQGACTKNCGNTAYYCARVEGNLLYAYSEWRTQDQLSAVCNSIADACTTITYTRYCSISSGGNLPSDKKVCYAIDAKWHYDTEEVCCDGSVQQKAKGGCAAVGMKAIACSAASCRSRKVI